jgi:RNA polymerase sigma-70 factor (ECF subfamily)
MFADFSSLRRWVGSDDVLQNAAIRLSRALATTAPESAREFFRLAALQIRRELLDLARHYRGPGGPAAHHESWTGNDPALPLAERSSLDAARLSEWTQWHTTIANLADESREVVDLLWYHGLSQQEAADVLCVSLRTLKRRWQQARLLLHEQLKDGPPS